MKVLLVEDNEQNRYLATFLLEQRGHAVVPAETGPMGIALARETLPDLILLDIQLPGMNGNTVARALRADADLRHADGCERSVEKPINPETLVSEIEFFLPKQTADAK